MEMFASLQRKRPAWTTTAPLPSPVMRTVNWPSNEPPADQQAEAKHAARFAHALVRVPIASRTQPAASRNVSESSAGLPDRLKASIESLSNLSMDDVRVHYNSSRPFQMRALAYTQGTNIYIRPGQEKHLAHEAWHIVQQKQGRVQPTQYVQGVAVNDSTALEHEAERMGSQVERTGRSSVSDAQQSVGNTINTGISAVIQCIYDPISGRDVPLEKIPNAHLEKYIYNRRYHNWNDDDWDDLNFEYQRRFHMGIYVEVGDSESETEDISEDEYEPRRSPAPSPQQNRGRTSSSGQGNLAQNLQEPSFPLSNYPPSGISNYPYPTPSPLTPSHQSSSFVYSNYPPPAVSYPVPDYPYPTPIYQSSQFGHSNYPPPNYQSYSNYPPPSLPTPLPISHGNQPPLHPVQPLSDLDDFVKAYRASRFTHATAVANMPSILQEGLHPQYAGTDKGATYARDPSDTKMIDTAKATGVHLAPVGVSENTYKSYLESIGKGPAVTMRVFLTNEQVGGLGFDPEHKSARGSRQVIPPQQLKPPRAQLNKPNDIQTRITVRDRKRKLLPIIATHMQKPHSVPELEELYRQASEGGYISDKDEF